MRWGRGGRGAGPGTGAGTGQGRGQTGVLKGAHILLKVRYTCDKLVCYALMTKCGR